MPGYIIILIALAAVLLLATLYNSLVAKRNLVDNAFALIDVQLKKRFDLIPNLVSSVKQYMKHESETLTRLTELRARSMNPATPPDERLALADEAGTALRDLKVQLEAYPDLKADNSFQLLMRSLNEVEEQLSAARRSYNAAVTDYNTAIQIFPYNLLAGILGFTKRTLFAASEEERKNPDVAGLFR